MQSLSVLGDATGELGNGNVHYCVVIFSVYTPTNYHVHEVSGTLLALVPRRGVVHVGTGECTQGLLSQCT